MRGAHQAIESAGDGLEAAAPRLGPSRPARIVAAPATAPAPGAGALAAGEASAALAVEAVDLPPRLTPLTRTDLVALAAAFALHVLLLAAVIERTSRIGGGGSDIEAMGVEIVMVAPALESRSLDGVRDRAAAGRVVGPDDGAAPSEESPPAPDRKPVEERRETPRQAAETAAAAADLVVPSWVEKRPPEEAPADEPVIARTTGDGERREAALRPTASEVFETSTAPAQEPAQSPSSPADAMVAALPGGFAARGRDVIDGATAVMAAARAGRKDKYGAEVYAALRASVPRPVPGVAGKVTVEFVVASTGAMLSSRIRATTGSRALEQAALAAVRSAHFPPPPPELNAAELVYSMEYTFR